MPMLDISSLADCLEDGLEKDPTPITQRLRFDDALEIPPEITDAEIWANFVNDDLYYIEKQLREYFRRNITNKTKKKEFKTATPLVFMWMFGRPATPQDSGVCKILNKLLRYYCTRFTGQSHLGGRKFTHVYCFSPYATINKRPYSIKLRLELKNGDSTNGHDFVERARR